jgi:glycosyltransferase involved in cell wall biosynthesis
MTFGRLATPVGALPEQVRHGETGLVAARADTTAIADALQTLAGDRALVVRMAQTVAREAPARSMDGFVRALLAAL